MRPEVWEKIQEKFRNYPPLFQTLNKQALDDPIDNPKMAKLLREIMNEGLVLLENDGTLPFSKNEEVAYFGINQTDHFFVGYGSGGDVLASYYISPAKALEAREDISYNKPLLEKYKEYSKTHVPHKGVWGYWSTYFDEMPITKEEIQETRKTSKHAVVFIGRASGEGQDNTLEEDQYYLNKEEKELLLNVMDIYGGVTIVINTGNINDFSWFVEHKDKIHAILLEWEGGMEAGHAVFDILYGDVNPSGKLTDTVAYSYKDYPSQNFGDLISNQYSEDIYVGYRYFETFAKDRVLYPFGYGLSYTSFEITKKEFLGTPTGFKILATVKNTGTMAGKEVVQVYVEKPNGKLGQPSRILVGFGKTKLLAKGEEDVLSISFNIEDLKSYDDSGATGNKSCYVLEEGEYSFYTGTTVRNAVKTGSFYMDKLLVVEKLKEECSPLEPFSRMKRVMKDGEYSLAYETTPKRMISRRETIIKKMPKAIQDNLVDISFQEVKKNPKLLDTFIASLSIEDLSSLCHGSGHMRVKWGIAGNAGMFGGTTEHLRSLGVPPVITCDGPSGIRSSYHATLFPTGVVLSASFNKELCYKMGDAFGEEIEGKTHVILAPGLNIHRNPLCGRNFEYFSEDPYVTGVFARELVLGIQKHGVSTCPKHFACNNQEANRNVCDSIVSERALREIYLKGFEMVVKEAKPGTIMTSYNKLNGVWSHYNSELVTNILREEWGYEGLVITDWWMQPCQDPDFENVYDNAYRVRGGIDVLMPGSRTNRSPEIDTTLLDSYNKNGITRAEMEQCAKHVLEFILVHKI